MNIRPSENKRYLNDVLDEFLNFEAKHDLFSFEIEGIPVWELVRYYVYNKIKAELCVGNIPKNDGKITKLFNGLTCFLKSLYYKNPFSQKGQSEILFLNHPRRKKNQGVYEDIYTDNFLPYLKSSYSVFEISFNFNHLTPINTSNLYYLDFIEFAERIRSNIYIDKKCLNGSHDRIKTIEAAIKKRWNVTGLNLEEYIANSINRYKRVEPLVSKLLDKHNPKKLVSVVSYSINNLIVNSIANRKGIQTIELQHGTVGNLHIAYNYPKGVKTQCFPKYFYSWGSFWTQNARLPIKKSNIIEVGFPYIEQYQQKFNANKKQKQIIVLSQMKEHLALFTKDLAKLLPEYKIIFKAHPAEYTVASSRYSLFNETGNVQIVDHDDINLYEFFTKSKFVVGINSTALIEALAFNASIIIVKYSGWEYFESLEESENISFVTDIHQAKNIIEKNKVKVDISTGKNIYFKANSLKCLIKELERNI